MIIKMKGKNSITSRLDAECVPTPGGTKIVIRMKLDQIIIKSDCR